MPPNIISNAQGAYNWNGKNRVRLRGRFNWSGAYIRNYTVVTTFTSLACIFNGCMLKCTILQPCRHRVEAVRM